MRRDRRAILGWPPADDELGQGTFAPLKLVELLRQRPARLGPALPQVNPQVRASAWHRHRKQRLQVELLSKTMPQIPA